MSKMENVNLRSLVEAQFAAAKRWWGGATVCRLAVVIVGIISALVSAYAAWFGLGVALLTVAYVLLQWHSDHLRNTAESVLRKLEMYDGLGWPITPKEISDLLLTVPRSVKAQARTSESENYFDSTAAKSSRRVLENLDQSTWMTRHQARHMFQLVLGLSAAVFAVAFVSLFSLTQNVANQAVTTVVAQIAIAVVVLMFSGGYARLAFSYSRLASRTERIEEQVDYHLKESDIEVIRVVKLLHEYQIVRAMAPMLPGWIWRRRQSELNELWEQYRQLRDTES